MSATQTLFTQEPGDTSVISINDVNQGWLGDCFVCAPIAALALERPDYIQNMIRDNGNGTQSVRLYLDPSYFANELAPHFTVAADNSTWITVNDVNLGQGMNTNNGGQLIVNGVQEIWPQVIEDAIAQVNGGYSNLNYGGSSALIMQQLTGAPATETTIALQNYGATTQPTTAQLLANLAAKDIVTFVTGAPDGHGLTYNHVYTLTSVDTEDGIDYAHFRNPWGYDDPGAIPVSDLGNAFVGMAVGIVPLLSIPVTPTPMPTPTPTPTPTTTPTPTPTTTPTTITPVTPNPTTGLVLDISEDAWQGDALYTVSVDGKQIGGIMTASASHSASKTQPVQVNTTLSPGPHKVTVSFLNDAFAGTASTDRNLYVDTALLNGQTIAGSALTLLSQGAQSFTVTVPTATTPTPTPTPAPTSPPTPTTGLVLKISEDAWQGDAQYTVKVDGQQIGGTMTASASHAAGLTQAIAVNTTLAAGQHTVAVTFLNDAYAGTPATDRNLYLDSATLNGQTIAGSTTTMQSEGTSSFGVTVTNASTTTTTSSAVVLDMSQDAWLGDAQFTVTIDGELQGGVRTAHASHAADQTEAVSFNPVLAAGNHAIAVSFLNDAYGGTPSTDRNLYLDNATLNGAVIPGSTSTMLSQSTYAFNMLVPST